MTSNSRTLLFRQLLEDPELSHHVPMWLREGLDPNHHIRLVNMQFGERIGDQASIHCLGEATGSSYLGLVLKGEAEVFDQSAVSSGKQLPIVAHRPIRLLKAGDIFGDFELLDRALARRSDFPSRETFRIVAGRRCFLYTGSLDNHYRHRFLPDSQEKEEFKRANRAFEIANGLRPLNQTSSVAFIDIQNILSRGDPPLEAWRQGWQKAAAYRDSVNSYNFSALLDFRSSVVRLASDRKDLIENGTRVYKKSPPALKTLPGIMADALFDALNRPSRGEPMYCRIPEQSAEHRHLLVAANEAKIVARELLFAASNPGDSFFYPLDMHNFLLNRYADSSEATTDLISVFAKHSDGAIGQTFYMGLANAAIQVYKAKHRRYPFEVVCKSMNGPLRPLLMLEFARATPQP